MVAALVPPSSGQSVGHMEHVVYTEREEPLPPHIVHEVHSDVERVSRRVSIVELSEPCYYVIIMLWLCNHFLTIT